MVPLTLVFTADLAANDRGGLNQPKLDGPLIASLLVAGQITAFVLIPKYFARQFHWLKIFEQSWAATFANMLLSSGLELGNQSWKGGEKGEGHLEIHPSEWDLVPAAYSILHGFSASIAAGLVDRSKLYTGVVNLLSPARFRAATHEIGFNKPVGPLGFHLWKCFLFNSLVMPIWGAAFAFYAATMQAPEEGREAYAKISLLTNFLMGGLRQSIAYRWSRGPKDWRFFALSDTTFTLFQAPVIYLTGAHLYEHNEPTKTN